MFALAVNDLVAQDPYLGAGPSQDLELLRADASRSAAGRLSAVSPAVQIYNALVETMPSVLSEGEKGRMINNAFEARVDWVASVIRPGSGWKVTLVVPSRNPRDPSYRPNDHLLMSFEAWRDLTWRRFNQKVPIHVAQEVHPL